MTTKQTANNKEKPKGEQSSGLPLLYKNPVALDGVRHVGASVRETTDFSFARPTNSLPINAIEFIEAGKSYPIVFTGDGNTLPAAIVGLEKSNYFVTKDNKWLAGSYVPAYIRQYPFIFFERPEEQKFYLCVDEASSNFSMHKMTDANALYSDAGAPTEFTNNALKFCTAFYQHHLITKNLCADLEEHKLLQPYGAELTLSSGRKTTLSGFKMIDEKALNALPNKVYLSFREKGWLPFIYFALASASNWKRLVDMEASV